MAKSKIDMLRQKLRDKPVEFAKAFGEYKPLPYQEEVIGDTNHFQIFVGGRRAGKSYIVAMKALWFAWTHPNVTVLVLSASEEQAKELVKYIKNTVYNWNTLKKTLVRDTQTELGFDNGSRIKIVAAGKEGKSARGFTADMVIIDEAAYVPEDAIMAVVPTIATQISKGTGYLILIGSPGAPKGFFYDAWMSDDGQWSKHFARTTDNPYVPEWFPEWFRKVYGELAYKREILGEFASTDDVFFNIDSINKVAILERQDEPNPDYEYYFGLDIAYSGKDDTALVIVGINKRIPDAKLEMITYYTWNSTSPSWLVWRVSEEMRRWNPKYLFMDSTSYGYAIYQLFREQVPDVAPKVYGLNFSTQDRNQMYFQLRKMIEDGEIHLLNDNTLKEQFMSYTITIRQNNTPAIKKKKKAKDDITDALALAVWGYIRGGRTIKPMPELKLEDLFPHLKMSKIDRFGVMKVIR